MNRKMIFAIIPLASLLLAGCNTVNGAGKDMRSAGKAVSEASGETDKK